MAGINTAEVRVDLDGTVNVAPSGTTLPTDTTTALDAAFVDLGLTSEEGVSEGEESNSVDISSWQKGVVRTLLTDYKKTMSFTLIQSSDDVLEEFYGDAFDGSGQLVISNEAAARKVLVCEFIDTGEKRRYVFPQAQLTARGEVVHLASGATGYPVTYTCYYDDTMGGVGMIIKAVA